MQMLFGAVGKAKRADQPLTMELFQLLPDPDQTFLLLAGIAAVAIYWVAVFL